MKRVLITLIATASLAGANTQGELSELRARQGGLTQARPRVVKDPAWVITRKPSIAYWRVHYSIRGSGRDITVLAESGPEARRVVMDMIQGAVVTGVHRITR